MSETYEGIVVRGEHSAVMVAFETLTSRLTLRVVPLKGIWFGIYRVAGRREGFVPQAMFGAARHFAAVLGEALTVFYDNQSGVRAAALVDGRGMIREIGEDDELWVPLAENGEPMHDTKPMKRGELQSDVEYECLSSAIDLGLVGIGASGEVTSKPLKAAFCRNNF